MYNIIISNNKGTYKQPNIFGYYGNFGGAYIPEMLHRNVEELRDNYLKIMYDEAFQKEYFTLKDPRVKNIRSISVRNEGLNSVVERLNGTMRDREKVMRGMQTKETAQKIIEAMRLHYNYIREHSALGKTPAESCGIRIEGENKLLTLIQNEALLLEVIFFRRKIDKVGFGLDIDIMYCHG